MRISFINLAAGSLAIFLSSALVLAQEIPAGNETTATAVTTASDATQDPAATATDTSASQPETALADRVAAGNATTRSADSSAVAPATKPSDASNVAPTTRSGDISDPAPVVTAPATPPAAPVVTFENGQLTVVGNNGTLSDILNAIQKKTGAVIESGAGMSTEQVIGQFGPGTPATVIAHLLNGTSLNYVLVGSSDGSQLAKVLLSIRPAHVDVQVADEGGSRHHRRGLEAMALEPQDQSQQQMMATAPTAPLRPHHRRRNGMAGATDAQSDSSDASSSDTTAANNATDANNPSNDPNATAGLNGMAGAIESAPGSPILPPDAPANIMKAIQHTHGPEGNPSPSARSTGFGPTPSSLGTGSAPVTNSGGSTYTLPNGATILGPGIPLPNGAIFFPGGAHIPGH